MKAEPNLRWRPYRDPVTNVVVNARRVAELYDEDVAVGHARLLEHDPPTREPDKLRAWNWSALVWPGSWDEHGIVTGGSERSKADAKAAAEVAYRRICEIPGAREANLKHSRERGDAHGWQVNDSGRADHRLIDKLGHS